MRIHSAQVPLLAGLAALTACGGEADREPAPARTTTVASTPTPAPASESGPDLAEVALADLSGDAATGKTLFTKCMACHSIEDGVNRVGPHLHGVVGRDAGSVEDFNYSDANRNSGITWSREVLFDYLVAPQQYIPGTRMSFPGLKDPQDRADLIAYLEANGEI
ncbi:cytochrome c family protein [Erythrobacter sp.]|uniref:c-type cytochrome n=1 Tax=Erythrobacter sp. TaxID=1042 RepID=UPI001425BE5A|nr:cytochrome c family protein [Erythrobacter sp.]QIQ85419.1 MAG: cytochrome c family protein [Erythrobacter sp.]